MSKAALPYLRAPARIMNVSSIGTRTDFKDLSLYCSSNAAMKGINRFVAAGLGPQGHSVISISPWPVQTDRRTQ